MGSAGDADHRMLTMAERTAVTSAVAVVLLRCQMESAGERMRSRLRARARKALLSVATEGVDAAAIWDVVLEVRCALGWGGLPRATPRWWVKRRTGGVWEDLRPADDAAEGYFRDELHMSPRVFYEIVVNLSPILQRCVTFYREPLQPDHIVAYVLYRWATDETYKSSTCSFGIGRASDKGFPNCHGCIDCTHIYVDKPANTPGEDYMDRKRRFSVQAQVVVDLDLRVLDVFVGYPGSCHDIRILHLSSLWSLAQSGELFTGLPVMLPFQVLTNGYPLGDNGYPPSEWIVVPYSGLAKYASEFRFDNKQKTARGAVERAFGRLKCMWRLFLRTHKTNMDTLPQQFVAVCILHNILIDVGIPLDENLLWEVDANGVRRRVDLGLHRLPRPLCMETSTGEAMLLRDALAERMLATGSLGWRRSMGPERDVHTRR
ncbi:hypothetical protein CBR_g20385 [Chara braunii]|uniref:DDE Tnp4 domain-containing protein n=1 Tax=Chara braunii TaxID=69332 RepID=A0A388JUF9_CHABU|nr:hypothetical protein CBR_g20385 [Chara braunii]|eukprot:GBG61352.1 hypothetical protein CBR_g20385 [Chara braunii]